jgi:DNA-binding XRE family transcriptional regulator
VSSKRPQSDAIETGQNPSEFSFHNWETNRTEPEVRVIPQIIDFLGYVPYNPNWSFGERLKAVRSALGLSQDQFAKLAGLDESTISKWEREEHKPSESKMQALTTFLRRQTGQAALRDVLCSEGQSQACHNCALI